MNDRRQEKGDGVFVSRHEILGILIEEMHELERAVERESAERVGAELTDIAVGCIIGIASTPYLDW